MSKGTPIGLRDLYYAILDEDTDVFGSQASYGLPVRIAGAISAKINPNASSDYLFADDGPYDAATTLGKISLELNVADLPLEVQSALLGHTMSGAILKRKATDVPPYVAIGFRSIKSNGKYRFTWLAKGKFIPGEQSNETKGDSVKFNTPTITGSFLKRDCDDEWERHIDEDSASYVASLGTNWFSSPYGDADSVKPTISAVTPVDAATAVPGSATITFTFSKAIAAGSVTKSTVMIFAQTGGSIVEGDITLSADRKTITLKPTADLPVGTYRPIVTTGVTDVYGNALAAAHVTTFTV